MRECHRNYAHGPMKLKTEVVEITHKGKSVSCNRTVYACTQCDFELQLDWMKVKMLRELEQAT